VAQPQVIIRTAQAADIPTIAQVESESWPSAMACTLEQVSARVAAYPAGQFVAEVDGVVVGVVFAQRITARFFTNTPGRFDDLTDGGRFTRSHDDRGDIYQIIGVGVARSARGLKLGRTLVDRQIEHARSQADVRRIIGFTRPADYHRRHKVPIDEYVDLRDQQGNYIDRVLAFHLDAGAKLVSIHPDFRPVDTEACGYGILIEYEKDGSG
jgi:rhizoxin synthesis polyketide synthase/nonribosomal peptide synthetase RhiA